MEREWKRRSELECEKLIHTELSNKNEAMDHFSNITLYCPYLRCAQGSSGREKVLQYDAWTLKRPREKSCRQCRTFYLVLAVRNLSNSFCFVLPMMRQLHFYCNCVHLNVRETASLRSRFLEVKYGGGIVSILLI